ncbi:MAG: DUF1553 domain-containing protein [Verrucomicrobia bacterium]|nr:DUF1553 domain-containing protein [Verrucomicrobiota bacterium]
MGLIAAAVGWADPVALQAAEDAVSFNRDIRPILANHCFACHGPDPAKRKARLRLDTRAGLFDPRGERWIVAAGEPDRSELFRRVTTTDADDLMPPPQSGKALSAEQVARLRRWVEAGAVWEGHWAYEPLRRPAVPPVTRPAWPTNPIDRFVLARLEREGGAPAPEADRRTLLRRLSFDLTGLPPTAEDVAAFQQDRQATAYPEQVERLLASPHHGERLAMYWLDVVRYADTDGFHADNYRSVWPYRDYVIRAFNDNKPFDQFTLEQLAGDLLPNATLEQRVASTYNRLGRTTEEGGAQPKEYLAKYAADRVRGVGTVWLGVTTGCAECHDHKFDPFTTRDFYRLAAYFADIKEQGVGKPEGSLVPTPEQERQRQQLETRIAELDRCLETLTPDLAAAFEVWEADLAARLAAGTLGWLVTPPAHAESSGGATLTTLDDSSVLVSGENPDQDTYTVTLAAPPSRLTAFRLEVLTHPSLDRQSLSRGNGNFVLTSVEVEVTDGAGAAPRRLALATAIADFSLPGHPVTAAIDDRPETGWAVAGHEKPSDHQAAFGFAEPVAGGPETTLTIRLKHQSAHQRHNIGRFRLSLIGVDRPTLDPLGVPEGIAAALREPRGTRAPEKARALEDYYLGWAPGLDAAREELATVRRRRDDLVKSIPTTLMTETAEPRVTRVLPRGNWMDDGGEAVQPAPPEFLGGPPLEQDRRATRLDLARWLMSPDQPLTARVFVNRLWKLFFGAGLTRSLDDLGVQGEWPTHPDLLDWLAVEFRDSNWDVRHLVRLMVSSSAYRQSATASGPFHERDPANRWLARQTRFRLDAEMVRDNALAISGLLSRQIGGPSVKPYQPAGYWDQLNFPKRTWEPDRGEALYRRGLYTFWCRTFLHPSLLAFDACTREEAAAERTVSNTPLQALALLNDPTYVEAARAFAERILRLGGPSDPDRVNWTVVEALGRHATPEERRILEQLVAGQRALWANDPNAAAALLGVGAKPALTDLAPAELAAWTAVARTVFNLHETIARF